MMDTYLLKPYLYLKVTSNSTQAGETNRARPAGDTVSPNILALSTHEQSKNDDPKLPTTTLRQSDDFDGP